MKTYRGEGKRIRWTNATGSAVASGEGVALNALLGVAVTEIANGAVGMLEIAGEHELPATAAEDWAAGDVLYWNATTKKLTDTADTIIAGHASAAKAALATTGRVVLARTVLNATNADSVTVGAIAGSDSSLGIDGLAAAQGGAIAAKGGTSSTTGNAGGAVSLTGGQGGATGAGGAASVVGGTSGATSGTGGEAKLTGGAAGSAAGNAVGGAATIAGGAGKGNLAGGAASVTGGVGGASGAGGNVSVAGGAGGSSSGNGGTATVAGGAGTAGNGNGGAASLLGGAKHSAGADGAVNVGTSNTSAVNVAAASIPTNVKGPLTASVGASTIAAGSTAADAGALPAGTAQVYPTTAANDAKGVIIDAADKVTGRMILIGNGVANKILKVYPPSGGSINGGSADAAFSTVSGAGAILVCLDSAANTWLAW